MRSNLTIRSVRWFAWTSSRYSGETRKPIAATENRRVDYEYERAGTAFMFCEALSSWCRAMARKRRTKVDWAEEVASLPEGRYADCEKIILVCDNPYTRTPGAFCEAFEPARARELVKRIEFRCTPKHGSWLKIAENELRIRQCLRHRRRHRDSPSRDLGMGRRRQRAVARRGLANES